MPFDLPTQAQWEYACRAGTTSLYNDGTDDDVTAMGRLGRCSTNQGDGKGEYPQCHTTVGSYLPNSWGLYDMHGNVAEMCLDWYTGTLAANVEDPEGPIKGTARVVCGGSWADRADSGKCSSPASTEVQPRMEMRYGFRLCCTLPDANTFLVSCSGESDPVAIGEPVVRTYVVRYAVGGDGVDGVMAEQALTNGMAATLNTNCFTRAGYEFAGWSRSLSGTVEFADGAEVLDLASGGEVTLYAVWTPLQVAAPTIFPPDGSTFTGDSCVVSMSCATEEADIYYTTNGRTPRINEACRYKGPFTITDTTTVLSFAVKGEIESTLVEVTITKTEPDPLTLKEVLDETKLDSVTTGGDADWTPVEDAGAKIGGSSARSGAVGMEQASWMETTVNGAGTLTFWWKTSCEADPRGRYTYDHAEFSVDGEIRERLDGESDWRQCEVSLDAPGVHVLRWTYVTDDWEEPGFQDCAWVDAVEWTPAGGEATETQTTEVPVPHVWLDRYFPGTTDYERTAKAPAANSAYSVMECYVAGLDPTDATATFSTVIEMRDCAPVISWSPNLNTNGVSRTYRILGRERLDDGNEWSYPTNSSHRFFKVSVGLPEP